METSSVAATPAQVSPESETARLNRVNSAGWTAGLSALFLVIGLVNSPSWPVATGVIALAAMVGYVCRLMLKAG